MCIYENESSSMRVQLLHYTQSVTFEGSTKITVLVLL